MADILEVEDLLSQLTAEGQLQSSGAFTVDLSRAKDKLARFQFEDPFYYILKLVQAAVAEGRRLGLAKVFALTREQRFFERLGFQTVPRESLPHKVWTDCVRCPLQAKCDEIAVVLVIEP